VGRNVVVRLISMQGCSIEGAEGPEVGEKCELYIDWQGRQLGAEARVVSREADGTMGLKFLSVDPDSQRRLSELCTALRIQPPTAQTPEIDHPPLAAAASVPAMPAEPSPAPPPRPLRERRRVPRYLSELPAYLTEPATGEASKVRLVTLSIFGGCLDGRKCPEVGERCDLNTEWNGKPLRLPAEVVWKSEEGRAGLKFAPLDAAAERLLREICSNLRLQPIARVPPPE